jgi:long-chain acyl-CoA synthetase
MTSYFSRYASLPHFHHGKTLDFQDTVAEVMAFFSNENLNGHKILIADSNPLRFALSFILLLENGASPIPVPANFLGMDDIARLDNLSWIKKTSTALSTSQSEPSYICLSSGTTGKPKEIRLSFRGALANAKAHADGFALSSENTLVQTLPIYHSFGIIAYILTPLIRQIPVDFSPELVGLRSFKTGGHRVLHISPSQARFILKDKFDQVVGVDKITIGAGAMKSEELNALQKKFPRIEFFVSYGLTEAGPRVSAGRWNPSANKAEGSESWIGQALPGVQLKVYDGINLSSEGRGTLCVQSPSLCLDLNPENLVQEWLKTRDEVVVKDQNIYFLSRQDDIIKCGGLTLFPAVIENDFRTLDLVTDVIVLKMTDPLYEEVPVLFVEGTIAKKEIEEYVSHKYAPAQRPRLLFVMEKFPRQSLNKIDRRALKEMMENHK